MLKYPRLFEPLAIGNVVFRNRLFSAPQGYYNVGADNLPSLEEVAFFERKAIGGFASVSVGDCMVDSKTGVHYPYLIRMEDPNTLPGLSAIASAITRNGAVASAELNHAGMYARFIKDPGGLSFGPDLAGDASARDSGPAGGTLYGPVYDADGKYGEVEAMSEEMILGIISKYGKAAAWAKRCGFNMVTIHGGHGWLLTQFMSPFVNTRSDSWGGSFENRMRFPLAVVDCIRENVGRGFPIEIRISGSECKEGLYGIDEGVKIAMALDGKVDILHISAGHHEYDDTSIITHPSMFLEDGVNVKYAAEIKKHVKTPVATVGALTDPAMMEEIIASGKADIVEMARQTLADPDLPLKARLGKDDDIDKCMRCCVCFTNIGAHRYLRCSINPSIGRELEERNSVTPQRSRKRVLVAGGGVGGMQAALSCAKLGHEVILCEKESRLGGILRCESSVPFKKRLEEYLDRQALRLSRALVEVRTGTEVTPDFASSLQPDAIIAALGARPVVPQIPGIGGAGVIGAVELYADPSKAGDSLAIIGGGLVGVELGLFMAGLGKRVTILEALGALSLGAFGMHTMALLAELKRLGLVVHTGVRVKSIGDAGVSCEGAGGAFTVAADTVVYATGQRPLRDEAIALSGCAPEFHMLGDCIVPDNILAATSAAYTIAKNVGRM